MSNSSPAGAEGQGTCGAAAEGKENGQGRVVPRALGVPAEAAAEVGARPGQARSLVCPKGCSLCYPSRWGPSHLRSP